MSFFIAERGLQMRNITIPAAILALTAQTFAQENANSGPPSVQGLDPSSPIQPSSKAARDLYQSAIAREHDAERQARIAYRKASVTAHRKLIDEFLDAQRTAEQEKRLVDAMMFGEFAQEEQSKLDGLTSGWTATIQANESWQHVVTLPGGKYLMAAAGKWSDNPNTPLFGPEGDIGAKNPPVPDLGALLARVNGRVHKIGSRALLDLPDDENYVEMQMSDTDLSDNRGSVSAVITEQPPILLNQCFVGHFTAAGGDGVAILHDNKLVYQSHGIMSAGSEFAAVKFGNGISEDQYLVGDFPGSGQDELAIRRGNKIYFQKHGISSTDADVHVITFGNGNAEDQYLVGDFTGIGRDGLAVRHGNQITYQTNGITSNASQVRVTTFGEGEAEDDYLAGDFTAYGRDMLAVRRGNKIIYQTNGMNSAEWQVGTVNFGHAAPGEQYLVGDFAGNGRDVLAVRIGPDIFYEKGSIADTNSIGVIRFRVGDHSD
jgi:hypothetical protein